MIFLKLKGRGGKVRRRGGREEREGEGRETPTFTKYLIDLEFSNK